MRVPSIVFKKKQFIVLCFLAVFVCILILSGCKTDDSATNQNEHPTVNLNEPKSVEQVGQIPDAFKQVIENNAFAGVAAFDGRLLKAEVCSLDKENRTVTQQIRMMDKYGNELAEYTFTSDDAYHVTTLTATQDGGFLFVLGFQDYAYSYDPSKWASDNGYASRVVKCDNHGNVQFDTPFDGMEGRGLEYCFEKNGQFYLFGYAQKPGTKSQGSYTDIYMAILDEDGNILTSRHMGGSDFDSLQAAEITDNGFVLSCTSQSDDGDFADSGSNGHPVDWVITVNDHLEMVERKKETGRGYSDYRLGEKDGAAVYKSDPLLGGFDAGTPEAFIDYGDFYLVISEHITGIYEKTPPAISSIWYYTETVYSAYDDNGKLIFRASVDSSPDYDARVEELTNQ